MQQDERLCATVIDLTHDGRGVADIDGQRVFVAGTLPGEEVYLKPRKRRRKFQEAELLSIERPARDRVEPACPFFGRCGGCALQHMSYEAQVRFKQHLVEEAFKRIGGVIPDCWLEPVTGPQWGYRRRARLSVRFVEGKGRVLVGFRERATTYITDMDHCAVLVEPIGGLIGELGELIGASSSPKRIPQVEIAIGDDAGAVVVRILEQPTERDNEAFAAFGRRHELDVYFQTAGPGSIQAVDPPGRALFYELKQFGLRLEFSPTDFVQVNAEINARMVADAVEHAALGSTDRVLDLYCGLGNFSLPFALQAGEVLGIEGEAGLVARAVHNAAINAVGNARFLTADLSQSEWTFLRENWDVVVLDPPRTGAEAAVAEMKNVSPRRIVYVSCHPATLARDAKVLCESKAYRLSSARVFDMFPNTHHVEVMAVFDRRGKTAR